MGSRVTLRRYLTTLAATFRATLFSAPDAALHKLRLAAAPSAEGGVQRLRAAPQVPARLTDGVLVAYPVPGEDGAAPAPWRG